MSKNKTPENQNVIFSKKLDKMPNNIKNKKLIPDEPLINN